jgi:hypothetical protein
MFDIGGPAESFTPDEGGGSGGEQLSEEARARFTAAAAGSQQQRKDEKKRKGRDDSIAQTILQFLTDQQKAHLSILIARLVARDCPSPFLLALLSLISESCLNAVHLYLADAAGETAESGVREQLQIVKGSPLDDSTQSEIAEWVARLQLVLSLDSATIMRALMLDDRNMDGTVLQLSSFIMQEFLHSKKREMPFEKLQTFCAGILHAVVDPFLSEAPLPPAKEEE